MRGVGAGSGVCVLTNQTYWVFRSKGLKGTGANTEHLGQSCRTEQCVKTDVFLSTESM